MSKLVSRADIDFLLYDVLNTEQLTAFERFQEHGRETFGATLDVAEQIATEYFLPHAAKLDVQEPSFDGDKVHIIPEVSTALDEYYKASFVAAPHEYDIGGMQLPFTLSVACKTFFSAANVSTYAYPLLSAANANVIKNFASDELKALYFQPLLDGRFMGTMALTEPQAGSSLSDVKTSAELTDDGSYRLRGNKIFISAGEHELSENIIHLVLARVVGAMPGVKGLSLFLVPKYNVNDDGSRGSRNDVLLGGLIKKMGYHGTTSTMLNFGENDGAVAHLIGEAGRGLVYMFQMMNEARIGVGVGAVALGYSGYLHALAYAKERPQGRHPHEKDPTSAQLPIIEHSDVRRMLLACKSYVEGGLCLSLYGAQLVDKKAWSPDQQERETASLLLDILTPVLKSWPSKYCLEANSLAMQVHGGYGYTREYPLERLYRDNRLNPIHEGTEGIQALDLLGRKVRMHDGAAYEQLCNEIEATIEQTRDIATLSEFSLSLQQMLLSLTQTTKELCDGMAGGDSNRALANASLYLDGFGHTVVAWLWLRQAQTAQAALTASASNKAEFYIGKRKACQYFFRWELPKAEQACRLLRSADTSCYDMSAAQF